MVILVSDTGISIPEGEQEAIFERFYQVDGGTSRQFGGTGLGLVICRHLADAMGGTISVESRLVQGSAFRIELPAQMIEVDAVPAPPASSGDAVLVIEPNLLAQRILAKGRGGILLFAGDIDTACARMADGGISRIMLQADPFLNGPDALADIRCMADAARAAGLNMIMLYTPSDSITEDDLREAGADIVIAKPVSIKTVVAALGLRTAEERPVPTLVMENNLVTFCSP